MKKFLMFVALALSATLPVQAAEVVATWDDCKVYAVEAPTYNVVCRIQFAEADPAKGHPWGVELATMVKMGPGVEWSQGQTRLTLIQFHKGNTKAPRSKPIAKSGFCKERKRLS